MICNQNIIHEFRFISKIVSLEVERLVGLRTQIVGGKLRQRSPIKSTIPFQSCTINARRASHQWCKMAGPRGWNYRSSNCLHLWSRGRWLCFDPSFLSYKMGNRLHMLQSVRLWNMFALEKKIRNYCLFQTFLSRISVNFMKREIAILQRTQLNIQQCVTYTNVEPTFIGFRKLLI